MRDESLRELVTTDFRAALAANRRFELNPLVLARLLMHQEYSNPGPGHSRLRLQALLAEGQLLRLDPLAHFSASQVAQPRPDTASGTNTEDRLAELLIHRVQLIGGLLTAGPDCTIAERRAQLSHAFGELGEHDEATFTDVLYDAVAGSLVLTGVDHEQHIDRARTKLDHLTAPGLAHWAQLIVEWNDLGRSNPAASLAQLDELRAVEAPMLRHAPFRSVIEVWDRMTQATWDEPVTLPANVASLPLLLRMPLARALLERTQPAVALELLTGSHDLRVQPFGYARRQLRVLTVCASVLAGLPPDPDEISRLIGESRSDPSLRAWIYDYLHARLPAGVRTRDLTWLNRYFEPDPPEPRSRWMVRLLEPQPSLTDGYSTLALSPTSALIVALLVIRGGRTEVDELFCACWPDDDPKVAANRFKVHLHKLRGLGDGLLQDVLIRAGDELELALPPTWRVDLWELEDACRSTRERRPRDHDLPNPSLAPPELIRHPAVGPTIQRLQQTVEAFDESSEHVQRAHPRREPRNEAQT